MAASLSPSLSTASSNGGSIMTGATAPRGALSAAAEQSRAGLVLMLGKLCTYMEQQSVPWVMETVAGGFVVRGAGAAQGGRGDLPPAFVPGEVARRLSAASSALLAAYVELHGRQLSLMVRRSVAATSWLQHKEPRGPRPVCDLVMERLGRAAAEVAQLVEDGGRLRGAASLHGPACCFVQCSPSPPTPPRYHTAAS